MSNSQEARSAPTVQEGESKIRIGRRIIEGGGVELDCEARAPVHEGRLVDGDGVDFGIGPTVQFYLEKPTLCVKR